MVAIQQQIIIKSCTEITMKLICMPLMYPRKEIVLFISLAPTINMLLLYFVVHFLSGLIPVQMEKKPFCLGILLTSDKRQLAHVETSWNTMNV